MDTIIEIAIYTLAVVAGFLGLRLVLLGSLLTLDLLNRKLGRTFKGEK